jgi:hypothetical protein
MGELKNAYNILVGKPERKRQLEGPRRRWEDNNITYLEEKVWDCGNVWPRCIWFSIGTSGVLL